MKLLFDQNISYRIVRLTSAYFPQAQHINSLGLQGAMDDKIWQFARNNDFAIVTFDADFVDIANLNGFPPKIIWLRFGNTKTTTLAEILMQNYEIIELFLKSDDYKDIACLEID